MNDENRTALYELAQELKTPKAARALLEVCRTLVEDETRAAGYLRDCRALRDAIPIVFNDCGHMGWNNPLKKEQ